MDQTVTIILFFSAILLFAGLLFAVITFTRRSPKGVNVEKYRCDWLDIEKMVNKDEPTTYAVSILNADSLLDKALQESGFAGKNMAERMKSAHKSWSHADSVWGAHKLRNRIAHESSTKVNYDTTRRALASFKRGLKDLGVI